MPSALPRMEVIIPAKISIPMAWPQSFRKNQHPPINVSQGAEARIGDTIEIGNSRIA